MNREPIPELSATGVAIGIGFLVGFTFWVGLILWLVYGPSDPQNAIGLMVSPCCGLWVWFSTAAVIAGVLAVRRNRDDSNGWGLLILGTIGLLVMAADCFSAYWQLTHPTRYPALR